MSDLGTGTGRDALWFAQRGHRTEALDFSRGGVGQVRRKAARAQARGAHRAG
ncbi:hypothetical protein G5V59_26405 [Nocardioides sp. W3-2-3]|uniref:methyltransferase domain-containing protein n=1 Tax=Nocardioides convexus TaxID=2712224 RepID=UPI002418BA34|nr:class I SAM-dependent methyltransferase [Nocardioides convexus]NHA01963.1 hypothetical protein [Nocardioides convexus]